MVKPILFLDVDGVLNVMKPDRADLKRREVVLQGKFAHHFYPTKFTLPFMRWAWDTFDVQWCTAWRLDANLIAKWAGLAERPDATICRSGKMMDWKLEGVQNFLKGTTPLCVWIEDGIGEEAEAWTEKQPNFLYVHTKNRQGVRRKHVFAMIDALKLPKVKLR
jgi:hypothetical protein